MNQKLCYQFNLVEDGDLNKCVELSADILKNDGVLLTPTDTVYGLVCLPSSPIAINKIFYMKERPLNTRLPIIVADIAQAKYELPLIWNNYATVLAETFWPGALTLACGIKANNINWLEGRVEAGIRIPDFPFIQKLARELGPLLMTSANRHGERTPHTVEGALMSLTERPDFVINGGTLSGAPSTLVNVNMPSPTIERIGCISAEEIKRVLHDFK